VKKRVGDEQVTELVVDERFWDAQNRKDDGARDEGKKPNYDDREYTPSGEATKPSLRPLKQI